MKRHRFDYKKQMNKKSRQSKNSKKKAIALVTSSLLVLNPTSVLIEDILPVKPGFISSNKAYAASLAEVRLLENINIDTELVELDEHYELNLVVSGTGLADLELVSPDRTFV